MRAEHCILGGRLPSPLRKSTSENFGFALLLVIVDKRYPPQILEQTHVADKGKTGAGHRTKALNA